MEDSDFSKMTVAELKKALKTRGLPVAGNKTELIARLQGAIATDGAADDGAEEDFDEDEILAGDETEGTDVKITPQEEAAALKGSVKIKKTTELQGAQEKKKISLKRSEPLLEPTEEAPAVEATPEAPEEPNKENVETTEPAQKVIKLNEVKPSEVYESRAQRFGIPMTEAARKEARVTRFGGSATNAKPGKLSMETGEINVDKLKSRAERFGEVTAKTLAKEKQDEVMKKRKEKFESSEIKDDVKTVKTVSKVNDETPTAVQAPKIVGAASDEEAKKLRAQRFGV